MDFNNSSSKVVGSIISPLKTGSYTRKYGNSGQEVKYSSAYFNSNYMEFVGYDTCDKIICTPG